VESGKNLYFIALLPTSPIAEHALTLQKYFQDHYGSQASLRSPPHITLHMPFSWRDDREGELFDAIRTFAAGQHAFPVQLSNYGCFKPRVIFIQVKPNLALDALQKELHRFCKQKLGIFNALYKDQPYHPHLTLAFRDLPQTGIVANPTRAQCARHKRKRPPR